MLFRKKKEIVPETYTEETCQSCNEITKRSYEEGDYVYRSGLQCKKCASANAAVITAIYGEYPEEDKRAKV
jgi:hypothetical protein